MSQGTAQQFDAATACAKANRICNGLRAVTIARLATWTTLAVEKFTRGTLPITCMRPRGLSLASAVMHTEAALKRSEEQTERTRQELADLRRQLEAEISRDARLQSVTVARSAVSISTPRPRLNFSNISSPD
jgi:hypothetical protein